MVSDNIKWIVSKSSILHLLCIKIIYVRYKLKVNRLLQEISANKNDIRTFSELIHEARGRKKSKDSKIAHIIGSGWSLNKTLNLVDKNDFVIGFNFSPLAPLNLDIYFFEFGGYKFSETSDFHRKLADKIVTPSGGKVYFKNIWADRNDVTYIKNYIKGRYPILKDYLVPCLSTDNISQSLKVCLSNHSDFVAQIRSTAFTAVFLAYYVGIRKIVLHGIDFGGGYFFEHDDFDGNKHYSDLARKCMYNKPLQKKRQQHPTALRKVGMKQILPILNKLLNEKGVSLYASSSISSSSDILPVFSPNPKPGLIS